MSTATKERTVKRQLKTSSPRFKNFAQANDHTLVYSVEGGTWDSTSTRIDKGQYSPTVKLLIEKVHFKSAFLPAHSSMCACNETHETHIYQGNRTILKYTCRWTCNFQFSLATTFLNSKPIEILEGRCLKGSRRGEQQSIFW